jgi:hypothetical protein
MRWAAGLVGLLAVGLVELALLYEADNPWWALLAGCVLGGGLAAALCRRVPAGRAAPSSAALALAAIGGIVAGILVYLALWSILRTCGSC